MTCIVGLVEQGEVYMGGDRCATWTPTGHKAECSQPKIARLGEMLIGGTGESSASDLAFWADSLPKFDGGEPKAYLLRQVAPWLRSIAQETGRMASKNGQNELPWDLLVAIRGRLFEIDDGGDVCEPASNFWAVGSGCQVALGSLHATARRAMKPEDRLRLALEAAAEFTPYTAPPFDIVQL